MTKIYLLLNARGNNKQFNIKFPRLEAAESIQKFNRGIEEEDILCEQEQRNIILSKKHNTN